MTPPEKEPIYSIELTAKDARFLAKLVERRIRNFKRSTNPQTKQHRESDRFLIDTWTRLADRLYAIAANEA